jgi:hypothetical protein
MPHRHGPWATRVACVVFIVGAISPGAFAVDETARAADSFVESIGVNTHYGNAIFVGGNAYANTAIDAKLAELGVRHIRDHSYNDTALTRVDGLYSNYGIRANLILGETTRSPADLVNLLKAHPAYEAIEGLNEPDLHNRTWNGFTDNRSAGDHSGTIAFQNELYTAVKADPLTQSRTVLSPAMADTAKSQNLTAAQFDVAAMHEYANGREPTFNLDTAIADMNTLRGSPAKPLMATEAGYYNQPDADTNSIPEHVVAKYMPRLFAEYFNRGVQRTYSYELADQGFDTSQREQNFGLLRFDLSEKPAFTAMENLIDLLEEPGAPAFTPTSLDYTLSSSDPALHHTLLQKSDGTFYLMLWQEKPGYNRFSGGSDINVAPLAVTLTLNDDISLAKTYLTNQSLTATATYLDPSSINLSVPDQMLVVELTPIPEPAGLVPLAVGALLARRTRHGARR